MGKFICMSPNLFDIISNIINNEQRALNFKQDSLRIARGRLQRIPPPAH